MLLRMLALLECSRLRFVLGMTWSDQQSGSWPRQWAILKMCSWTTGLERSFQNQLRNTGVLLSAYLGSRNGSVWNLITIEAIFASVKKESNTNNLLMFRLEFNTISYLVGSHSLELELCCGLHVRGCWRHGQNAILILKNWIYKLNQIIAL